MKVGFLHILPTAPDTLGANTAQSRYWLKEKGIARRMVDHALGSTIPSPSKTPFLWNNQARAALSLEIFAVVLNIVAIPFCGLALALIAVYTGITNDTSSLTTRLLVSDAVAIGSFNLALAGIVLGHLSIRSSKKSLKGWGMGVVALSIGYFHVGVFLLRLLLTMLAIIGELSN